MSKKSKTKKVADVVIIHGGSVHALGSVTTVRQVPGSAPLCQLDEPDAQKACQRDARVFHEWIRTHLPYGTYAKVARMMANRLGVEWPWEEETP